ncbi:MAG: CBS domain-containing protein [Candidatus Beckwithbacteria bacterium]|nr:CBS domain-containing protein [Candidatus Beckwithbacteria bacterium]
MIAQDLLKTDGILTANPDDSLASALAQIHSSHDAVFVKDRDKLLGVVSPYHVLYRTSYPAATKVKNCLFSPPRLKPETKVETIARLMLESKVYFLPIVTSTGKWLGIVSYRRLLRRKSKLTFKLKTKALVTIKETASIGQARSLMKLSGVSRLVVISDSGRLTGILTRYDLGEALGRPQTSPNNLGRVGEKTKAAKAPVKRFIKRDVMAIKADEPVDAAITMMLDRKVGSLVIVNNHWQPVGIISVRDCLAAIAKPSTHQPSVTWKLPQGFPYADRFIDLVNRSRLKWQERWPLLKFDLKLNTHKSAANKVSGYKVLLQAKRTNQKQVTAKGSGRDWKVALQKGLARLTRQLKKQ